MYSSYGNCVVLPQNQLPAILLYCKQMYLFTVSLLLIFTLAFVGLYPVWVSWVHTVLWLICSDGISLCLSSLLLERSQRLRWPYGSGTDAIRVRRPTTQTLLCTLIPFLRAAVCVCVCPAHALVLIPVHLH